jgi:hypothetical protein
MELSSSYQKAFDRLLSEIEGDKILLNKHANVLLNYATNGDCQGKSIMANLIPEGAWSWDAYNKQIGITTYKTRCGWFLRRLASYAFSIDSIQRMQESASNGIPLKAEFLEGKPQEMSSKCKGYKDAVVPVGSHEHLNMAPCERLSCSCCWVPKVDFSKPVTPSGYISKVRSTI